MIETTTYARGTMLRTERPWGWFLAGRALCTDGHVRALKRIAATADTFFSVPAAVTVEGRTVSGFITVDGSLNDPAAVIRFRATGRNAYLLPRTELER